MRPIAEAKGLRFELEGSDAVVQGDRRALSQIVLNLAGNAMKFTERGAVRLSAVQRDGAVEISVADTGVGIRPEDQASLFEAFTRLGDPATRHQEGTGLGLHLSQKLAALLGGRIIVQSEHGRGSTFTLRLVQKRAN